MKTKCLSILITLMLLAASRVAIAQSYSISWYKVAGGGGTCTNGPYALSGTIGQQDASAAITNGRYSITGGFWSFIGVVQSPGAPTLKILPAGPGQATISWSPNTPGYRLQETTTLSPAIWIDSPSGVANPVTVQVTNSMKHYRLITP